MDELEKKIAELEKGKVDSEKAAEAIDECVKLASALAAREGA